MLLAFGLASVATAADGQKGRKGEASKTDPGRPGSRVKRYKVDNEVTRRREGNPNAVTDVIVTFAPGVKLPAQLKRYARHQKLTLIDGAALSLPNRLVKRLEKDYPELVSLHWDRPIGKENYRTAITVGARAVNQELGYTGKGVGVAVIDSGIATWHNDLTQGSSPTIYPHGNQRVSAFVDFVNGRTQPYDDNGHGSHVAGIISGNGYDSRGEKAGIAPEASLVSLKVLDANGTGTISNIIAAFDWIVANRSAYNIRVVNISVGAKILESYWTDPLTLAAKRVVDSGIVVVGAAGNFGKNALGRQQWGGITAPSNAPWVLTVGASSTEGTLTRGDDKRASYSSSGPTFKDFSAKPDLLAPGTGTVSLAVPGSTFYVTKALYLLQGRPILGHKPYLTLSGTSMASPVVAGTVALMIQANPALTPNLVKAILQYTAQSYHGIPALKQGAGFLNSLGAVRLARFYAKGTVGSRMPIQKIWSKKIIWGNHRLSGGYLNPLGSAWVANTVWGAAKAANGLDNIVWGTDCGIGCDNIVWGTNDRDGDNIVWGTHGDDNIVWGTAGDDNIVWGTYGADNIVWGTSADDNIVWGTGGDDNIVWGTSCGGADCDNIVWGTTDSDNIVWGTSEHGDNIVWGTGSDDNIVWGTSSEFDTTWGSAGEDNLVYPDDADTEPLPDLAFEFGEQVPDVSAPASIDVTELAPIVESPPSLAPVAAAISLVGGGL